MDQDFVIRRRVVREADLLPQQACLNTDEAGHKENGRRYWIWCFRAASFVVFRIDPSLGTEVLMRVLGQDFKGILGCDDYAAYRKYARQCSVLVQFCLAKPTISAYFKGRKVPSLLLDSS